MITKRFYDTEEAIELASQLGKTNVGGYFTKFRKAAAEHFKTDYQNRRGAYTAGLENSERVVPFIEVDVDPDDTKRPVDLSLIVGFKKDGDWAVLDRSEALGYNYYISQASSLPERIAKVKADQETQRIHDWEHDDEKDQPAG